MKNITFYCLGSYLFMIMTCLFQQKRMKNITFYCLGNYLFMIMTCLFQQKRAVFGIFYGVFKANFFVGIGW
jgi:hypothetical protein